MCSTAANAYLSMQRYIPHYAESMSRVEYLSIGICILLLGYLCGRAQLATQPSAIVLSPDERPVVTTVSVEGIRDGQIYGHTFGSVRLLIDGTVVSGSGAFRAPAGALLTHQISVHVPAWAQFVASSRGSKYYTLGSAGGNGITPKNRIYFRSATDAESAGYRP